MELLARGRHDPCVVPRAVPMVEAVVALVLADQLLTHYAQCELLPRWARLFVLGVCVLHAGTTRASSLMFVRRRNQSASLPHRQHLALLGRLRAGAGPSPATYAPAFIIQRIFAPKA